MPPDKPKGPLRVVKGPPAIDGQSASDRATAQSAEDVQGDGTCPFCFGTGMEMVPEVGARRCRCQSQDYRQRLFQAARIPPRYQHCFLANFEADHGDLSKWGAKGIAGNLIESYPEIADGDGTGLLFIGPVGVGKTHLAVAILREAIERYNVRGLFYQFGALLKEIQNSYNPVSQTSELKVLEPVFEADILVLDELGASKPTDWVRDTMMQIINTRYNDKCLTIFTTNYDDRSRIDANLLALKKRIDGLSESSNLGQVNLIKKQIIELDKMDTLEDRIGTALRSRLYEMCRTVRIEGEDYRRKLAARLT